MARALRYLAKQGESIPEEKKAIKPFDGKLTQFSTGVVDVYRQPDGTRTRPSKPRGRSKY
jgi:hypothetical protein